MFLRNAKVYPILYGCWMSATLIIPYLISVMDDHVKPILPVTSDTGNFPPESCIFGTMMNIGAVLNLLVLFIRYRQLEDIQKENKTPKYINKLSICSLCTGLVGSFGQLICANFQAATNSVEHDTGSISLIIGYTLYQIIQTFIAFKIYPLVGKKSLNIWRIVNVTLCVIAYIILYVCNQVALQSYHGTLRGKWSVEDGGYENHLASAFAEYILLFLIFFYFTSFAEDFKLLEINFLTLINKKANEENGEDI